MTNPEIVVYKLNGANKLIFHLEKSGDNSLTEFLRTQILWNKKEWREAKEIEITFSNKKYEFRYLVLDGEAPVFGIPTYDGLKVIVFDFSVIEMLLKSIATFICDNIILVEIVEN